MVINKETIEPGEERQVRLQVANLPSGTEISLIAHVYRSKKPGPTLLLIGGVHGDEINGVEIVRRFMNRKIMNFLTAGTIIAVPLLNVYGFINFSREFPDGKDVNRSFPGAKAGSLAAAIAYKFTQEILPLADLAIDFHTGGKSVYNYPQVRYSAEDERSFKLAKEFNMPVTVQSGLISRSLRKTAYSKKIPMVVFEGGESLRIDELSIKEGISGILKVLKANGMTEMAVEAIESSTFSNKTWVRSNKSGIFICEKKSGDFVEKGGVLGRVTDPYNTYQSKIKSKVTGFIFGHNNNPVVNKGDALFHIGYNEEN